MQRLDGDDNDGDDNDDDDRIRTDPGKPGKSLNFVFLAFRAWKVMEFCVELWKVMEN